MPSGVTSLRSRPTESSVHRAATRPARDRRSRRPPPGSRRHAPALFRQLVRFLLLDEQPRGREQPCPARDVVEPEPAAVAGLAQRHRDEHPPARPENPGELAQRLGTGRRRILDWESVPGVVGSDVLECRDEEHLVDARVRERQGPHVGDDPLHAFDVALREVDPDELAAGPEERDEIRRLRERVSHLQYSSLETSRESTHGTSMRRSSVPAGACSHPSRSPRARAPSPSATASSSSRTRSASCAVASSWRNVARDSVPSASFASARSRASSSGGRRSSSRNARSTKSGSDDSYASSPARTRGSIRGQPYA